MVTFPVFRPDGALRSPLDSVPLASPPTAAAEDPVVLAVAALASADALVADSVGFVGTASVADDVSFAGSPDCHLVLHEGTFADAQADMAAGRQLANRRISDRKCYYWTL